MICDRENEIETFVPEEYWTIDASRFKRGRRRESTARFYRRWTAKRMDRAHPRGRCGRAASARLRERRVQPCRGIKKSERRKYARSRRSPPPTSSRRPRASWASPPGKTMQIAQQLYEGVELAGEGSQGLVTYIRTDSTRIADEALAAVREHDSGSPTARPTCPPSPTSTRAARPRRTPTRPSAPLTFSRRPEAIKPSLSRDQFRLYRLIYDRFVSSQMTPAVFDTLSAWTSTRRHRPCASTSMPDRS